jgi:primosomal protein N' (replication factor Y)
VLDGGSQVLYLLPEIALTTQIVNRLRKVFGDQVGIYHSKFSDNERVEVWQGVLSGKYSFVIGVRSAIFSPSTTWDDHRGRGARGLIQAAGPGARYNARDLALVVARFQKAKVLLGFGHASFESFYHAQQGRYGYVKLGQRFGNTQLPEMVWWTCARSASRKRSSTTSRRCCSTNAVGAGPQEQIILFQNRRGYAPVHCLRRVQLDTALRQLRREPHAAPAQQRTALPLLRLPRNIAGPVPGLRLHQDQNGGLRHRKDRGRTEAARARSPARADGPGHHPPEKCYQQIIQSFEVGEMDVLIGTQMVSKGLDFERVGTVGIFDADRVIHFPDFRSHERAFQLLTQVSGRAGRRDKRGKVIIQTADPQH